MAISKILKTGGEEILENAPKAKGLIKGVSTTVGETAPIVAKKFGSFLSGGASYGKKFIGNLLPSAKSLGTVGKVAIGAGAVTVGIPLITGGLRNAYTNINPGARTAEEIRQDNLDLFNKETDAYIRRIKAYTDAQEMFNPSFNFMSYPYQPYGYADIMGGGSGNGEEPKADGGISPLMLVLGGLAVAGGAYYLGKKGKGKK